MTLRRLLNKHNYKKIFNLIFSNFLRKKTYEEVRRLDVNFLNAFNELLEIKPYDNYKNCSIYVTEFSDDLEKNSNSIIDVCLIDNKTDEIFALDFLSWSEIIDLDVKNSTTLEGAELLSHILWEITFWGFSDSRISQERAKLKDGEKDWEVVEIELKDLYNLGDEPL
jgi:hypothetical protein